MKRLFKSVMLFAAAAMAFTSCDKDQIAEDIQIENGLHLTITTDKPEAESVDGTRTGMDENGKPYWLPEDKIGVSINLVDQAAFENTNKDGRSEKTTFSGNLKSVGSDNVTVYAYYPYNNKFVGENARALINKDQSPTLTSFDGESDILVAKPMTVEFVDGEATAVGMQFKRVSGVLKVVLIDDENLLAGECVSELSVSSTADLAGYVRLDLANSTDLGLYAEQKKTVTAIYDKEQYEVGKGATYLNVYPQTLAEDSSLTISANTDNYRIYKNIVLKQNIEIVAGKMTTLNIHIGNENVSGAESEFESDDIFVCSEDDSTNKVYSLSAKNGGDTKFNGKKATGFKLGASGVAGTFEATTATDVTENYTLSFYAVGWKGSNVNLTVSVAGKEKTYKLSANDGASGSGPTFTINEVTDANKYTIALKELAGGETIKFTTSKGDGSNGDVRAVVAGVHLTEGFTEGADDLEESTTEPEPEPEDPTDGVVVTLPYTLDTNLSANKGSNSAYAKDGDVTVGGVTWNAEGNMTTQPWRIGGSSIQNQDRAVYTKTAMKADVKKIEVAHGTATLTVNSFTVIVAADADFANKLYEHTWKSFAQNSTTTIARPESDDWNGCYYKFVYNVTTIGNGSGNQYVQLSSIRFSDEDGVTTPDATEPETPEMPETEHEGSFEDPFNVADALLIAQAVGNTATSESYYVAGTIKAISEPYGSQYGNATFDIVDKGSDATFTIFRVYYFGGEKWKEGNRQIQEGDEVVVYGQLMNYDNTTPEMQMGGKLISLNGDTSDGTTDPDPEQPEQPEQPSGGTATIDLKDTGVSVPSGTSYVSSAQTFTIGGISYTAHNFAPKEGQVKGNTGAVATQFYINNNTAYSGKIKTVTMKTGATDTAKFQNNCYCATDSAAITNPAGSGTAGTISADGKTITWNLNSSDSYFMISTKEKFTSGNVKDVIITVEYE